MKIFVTGATGFVGAHTVLALLDAGHQARLLVRDEAAARRYFNQRGRDIERYVTADIRDLDAVRESMRGCDAVFHAAAMVSLDPKQAAQTYANNVGATQAVIGAACELGITRIVYVSSLSALFHPGRASIDEDTPLANPQDPYSRSKRDSDEWVRGLQREGRPIQITYPSAIVGPDDPKLSQANFAISAFVSQVLLRTTSGFQCVDVRDLAMVHRWMLEHPHTGRIEDARYIVGGHYYPWAELHRCLEQLLGRRLFSPRVAPGLLRMMGRAVDRLQNVVPFDSAVTAEAMAFITQWPPASSQRLLARSGLQFRSGEDTFADTIRWLVAAGHMKPRYAGRLFG